MRMEAPDAGKRLAVGVLMMFYLLLLVPESPKGKMGTYAEETKGDVS